MDGFARKSPFLEPTRPTRPCERFEPASLSVEFDNGALRYIRLGDVEVLARHRISRARRELGNLRADKSKTSASTRATTSSPVTYRGTCSDAKRTLVYDAKISGKSDGSLSFEVVAEPRTDVLTNRTGFIVLHPVEGVSGHAVKVRHVDGSEETSTFPETIDPRCPFKDIRSLSHEIAPGVWATCTMEGDAFEMEDQRNWSDASYKTYVRPLTRPWPYTLPKGEKVTQSVTLTISGTLPARAGGTADQPVSLTTR